MPFLKINIKLLWLLVSVLILNLPNVTRASELKTQATHSPTTNANPIEVRALIYGEQAQSVLAEWFSIDPEHDINMQYQGIEPDELGERFSLNFISDDQQAVNGILSMPEGFDSAKSRSFKFAMLLHPMGSDLNVWFNQDSPIKADRISQKLRQQGYAVLALDARRHGLREVGDIGLRDLLGRAHSPNRRLYDDMIIGTVRDYRLALAWVKTRWDLSTAQTAVVGYSMGAQMSLLLASYEPSINHIVSMVPPYVDQVGSPVAPRHHVSRIKGAHLLFLAAKQDPYSSTIQNNQVFNLIGSEDKSIHFFDSGHVLPESYQNIVMQFIEQQMNGGL